MKKKKTFCDLSKDDIKEKLDELILLTHQPRYICVDSCIADVINSWVLKLFFYIWGNENHESQ